jgi:transcriptional regulator with XRE-family HTH domain
MSMTEPVPIPVRDALLTLGDLISAARRERGMSQDDLPGRVGVNRNTIRRIERGASGLAAGSLLTAAWVLGLPILRSNNFAGARSTSAVGAFLSRLNDALPERAGRHPEVDGDF